MKIGLKPTSAASAEIKQFLMKRGIESFKKQAGYVPSVTIEPIVNEINDGWVTSMYNDMPSRWMWFPVGYRHKKHIEIVEVNEITITFVE